MSLNNSENLCGATAQPTSDDIDKVVSILMRSFGATTDSVTIRNVALSCNGNITRSIESLMELSKSGKNKINPSPGNKGKSGSQNMPPKNTTHNENYKANNDKPPKDAELSKIIDDINKGYRVLIFMRGLPGSGKSTLAQQIIAQTVIKDPSKHIFSSDDFFSLSGTYRYNVNQLSDAHTWNQGRVCKVLKQHFSPIIVDNTNLELWEMHVYATTGVLHGYKIEVLEPKTWWAFKPAELAKRNSHGVTYPMIKRKMEKYQGRISGTFLLNYLHLSYPQGKTPPIMKASSKVNSINDVSNVKPLQFFPVSVENTVKAPSSVISLPSSAVFISWENDNLLDEMTSSQSTPFFQQVEVSDPPKDNLGTFNKLHSIFNTASALPKNGNIFGSQDIPKPQRTFSGSKLIKSSKTGVQLDSVNWEPIDVSLCNWDSDATILEPIIKPEVNEIISRDSSSNTQSFDFNPANWDGFKVITAKSRDINFSHVPSFQCIPPKFGLDKGTMTFYDEDISLEGISGDKLDQLRQLRKLFPGVPMDDISHILGKCKGDVNWAVDLLLDDKTQRGATSITDVEVDDCIEDDSSLASFDTIINESFLNGCMEPIQPIAAGDINLSPVQNGIKNVKIQKKDKVASESSVILKKQLEENFDFCNDLYSDHVIKLKNKIHKGKYTPKVEEASNAEGIVECVNDTNEKTPSECSDDIEVIEDVISINMGADFINQMDDIFNMNIKQFEKLEPIIHMPVSLLNQMYALWIESVINQLDVQREFAKAMIREDEEFARLVQSMEDEQQSEGKIPAVPNLQEIMEMEMTLATYKANMTRWEEETPITMALNLTRQKLCQLFPSVDKEILMEVLNAHDNNFEQTVQVLLVSLGRIPMSDASEVDSAAIQKLLAIQEKDLLERANQEKQKVMMTNADLAMCDDEAIQNMDQKSTIAYLRKQAAHHLIIRNKNHQKAKEYFARGMPQVASYYSHMAALHTKKLEYANNKAAMGIIQASASGRDEYTLDLHYLYVAEAMEALDIFVDKHISRLGNDTHRSRNRVVELFLITGRGKHSPGGLARIKIATKKRLEERKLRFCDFNEGAVKIMLTPYSLLTDAVSQSLMK